MDRKIVLAVLVIITSLILSSIVFAQALETRDLESWLKPRKTARLSGDTKDGMKFGRDMGVDMDLIRECDAACNGAVDARQKHYIREDIE